MGPNPVAEMNVRTMFFYKVLGLLLLPAILLYLYMNDEVIPFDCSSEFHVYHEDNGKNEIDVFSSVKINFHIPSNDKGIITEYGVINYEKSRYIVDRVIKVSIFREKKNSYELIRQKPVKNPRDNLPDIVYEELVSRQESLYYDIRSVNNDTLIFSDSKRTLFVCKKKKT
ncbi:Uncharacterised protein [Serratia liquefaciens]|nr:Uncharacterised protein [Serratia liquefaciens]